MKNRSKKYTEAVSKIEKGKVYTKEEAVKLVKETSITKFDGTVEVALRLNLDTKKADQQLRGAIVLPKGTGKPNRVIVIAKAVEESKAGRVEYRNDSFGNVHAVIVKVSFTEDELRENLDAFVQNIIKIRPTSVKGDYIKNITITSTMGPGIKVSLNSFDK